MRYNKLAELSMELSVEAINFTETISGHASLKNQFERCVTSIGANIHESNYANSKADFISKLHIALKECFEAEYWLKLFLKSNLGNEDVIKSLSDRCGTIRRILVASINTAKQ